MTDDAPSTLNRELIQGLCLEAGRIMEDTSADLALVLSPSRDRVAARVDQLHRAAHEIMALANAARALIR
jgi:hypothetical protein